MVMMLLFQKEVRVGIELEHSVVPTIGSLVTARVSFSYFYPCMNLLLEHFLKKLLFVIEKFPFTYWLNGRWFLQIVGREFEHAVKWKVVSSDSRLGQWESTVYPIYPPFHCSDILSQRWGGGGGGLRKKEKKLSHFMFSSCFML